MPMAVFQVVPQFKARSPRQAQIYKTVKRADLDPSQHTISSLFSGPLAGSLVVCAASDSRIKVPAASKIVTNRRINHEYSAKRS